MDRPLTAAEVLLLPFILLIVGALGAGLFLHWVGTEISRPFRALFS